MPFNEAVSMFCHTQGANPFPLRYCLQRRRQAEHVAAFITAITKNDLLLMMPSLAQLTVECEDVVWHSYVFWTVGGTSFALQLWLESG